MKRAVVFLLDEDLASRSIVDALRSAGLLIKTVPDEFGRGRPDVEWLSEAGKRGYVVLTKDKAMRRSPMEVAVIREFRVRYFALAKGNLTAAHIAAAILTAAPQIEGIVGSMKGRRAVLARITAAGRVNVNSVWP